jgi:zinc transport system substrate-binding protein
MSRNLASLSLAASLLAGTALADVPNVAVDITPVHSLVARVMAGVGEPTLIIAQGASPHEYSLRPSEAGALQEADLVFWIGPDLTPWLEDAIETLAGDATLIELMEAEGTTELPSRENALFEAHLHGEEDHAADHEDHDHDEHSHDGDNDEHSEHADHADEHAAHDGHDHGDHDPHAWLSPDNGAVWLNAIAAALSAADPENAGAYYSNAAAGRDELTSLRNEINGILDPVREERFIVFHDAYQYFEDAFDFPASGAISVSDATDPSPARIAEIQSLVADQNITCAMSEPQFDPGIVASVMDGSEVRTGIMDPLGSDLEPGADLYPQLLRNLATSLAGCL